MLEYRVPYTLEFVRLSKIKFKMSLAFSNPIKLTIFERICLISKTANKLDNSMSFNHARLEIRLISSLTGASHCHKHPWKSLTAPKPSKYQFLYFGKPFSFLRWKHSQHLNLSIGTDVSIGGSPSEYYTKEELLKLVDHYKVDSTTGPYPCFMSGIFGRTSMHKNTRIGKFENNRRRVPLMDQETKEKVLELTLALEIDPKHLDHIFDLYRALPDMRICYLNDYLRHKLMHVLSVVEFKNEHSMLRYLSVVEDIKAAGLELTVCEWNSAISFVARYVRVTTTKEVEAALRMWREMENSAGIRGDEVTFNILFDVACRAGKFTLAEMIYKEMGLRGLEYTRYHYATKIMFHGLRQDGDGVRAAYRELVEAGEIVDTVILNVMISALIKAREPSSAETLYQRMKSAHLARVDAPLPPKDFLSRRYVNQALMQATRLTKRDKKKRGELQKKSIIAPDCITYLILIEYYSVQVGDLSRTVIFLEEMKWFAIPVRGAIFVKLFKGFFIHGRGLRPSWTGLRLELVYKSFLELLDSNETELFISWWIVLWMLKAFLKCTNASRALMVWEEVASKWKPESSDMEYLTSVISYIKSRNFGGARHYNSGI